MLWNPCELGRLGSSQAIAQLLGEGTIRLVSIEWLREFFDEEGGNKDARLPRCQELVQYEKALIKPKDAKVMYKNGDVLALSYSCIHGTAGITRTRCASPCACCLTF